jgi:hypothetical protein
MRLRHQFFGGLIRLQSRPPLPSPPTKSDPWARGFWQSFAASWAYALSLALAALCIKLARSDIITLLRNLIGPGH